MNKRARFIPARGAYRRTASLALSVLVLVACGAEEDRLAPSNVATAAPDAVATTSAPTAADATPAPTTPAPTTPAPTTPAPTTPAPTTPAPEPDLIPEYLFTPPKADMPSTDLLGGFARVAALQQLSPHGSDGLVVLGAVPPQISPDLIFMASGENEETAGYSLNFSDPQSESAGDDLVLTLGVSTTSSTDDHVAALEAAGWRSTELGPHVGWLNPEAQPDCNRAPDDGPNTTVLTWFDGGLQFSIDLYPVPDCDPASPFSVSDVLEIAKSLAVCSGWAEHDLSCAKYIE